MTSHDPLRRFPDGVDQHVSLASSNEAFFGRDVLRGLVAGIEKAAERPTSHRSGGAVLLGCSPWMDDLPLINALKKMGQVCVVINKQKKREYARKEATFSLLHQLARERGITARAYPELREWAPAQEGRPLVVGPATSVWDEENDAIPAIRELGFRANDKWGDLPPLLHSKMALLGHMVWTDEHPAGSVVDEGHFIPERLWIGSANFTGSSRRNLEMGMWTTDETLMGAAERHLLDLIGHSEPLQENPMLMEPELAPVEYDEEAMLEAARYCYVDEDE